MKKRIQAVVIAVVRKENKYLLTLRSDLDKEDKVEGIYNAWQFPGGGLEFGEGVEECLHRECIEELGVDVKIKTLIPKIYHDIRGGFWHGIFLTYLCTLKDPNAKIVLNEEASDYTWVKADEVRSMKKLPFTQEIFDEAEKIA